MIIGGYCLIINDVNLNLYDTIGNNALHCAALYSRLDIMRTLLRTEKCDVNKQNVEGRTPIFYGVQFGPLELVDLLLSYGAEYNIVDKYGNNLLHFAVTSKDPKIVSRIISLGIDVNYKNLEGQRPLSIARQVHNHNLQIINKYFIND